MLQRDTLLIGTLDSARRAKGRAAAAAASAACVHESARGWAMGAPRWSAIAGRPEAAAGARLRCVELVTSAAKLGLFGAASTPSTRHLSTVAAARRHWAWRRDRLPTARPPTSLVAGGAGPRRYAMVEWRCCARRVSRAGHGAADRRSALHSRNSGGLRAPVAEPSSTIIGAIPSRSASVGALQRFCSWRGWRCWRGRWEGEWHGDPHGAAERCGCGASISSPNRWSMFPMMPRSRRGERPAPGLVQEMVLD